MLIADYVSLNRKLCYVDYPSIKNARPDMVSKPNKIKINFYIFVIFNKIIINSFYTIHVI